MTTNTDVVPLSDDQIEALWQSLPVDQTAFARDSAKGALELRIRFARALLSASKPAVPAIPEEVKHALTHAIGGWRGAACGTRDDSEGERRSADYNRRAQVIEDWLAASPAAPAQSCDCGPNCLDRGIVEGCRYAAPDHIGDAAEKVGAPAQSGEPMPVEVWHGDRKVTIYNDCVLRAWGTNIESEMSDVPRTLQTVQDALDWLYADPQPASGGE